MTAQNTTDFCTGVQIYCVNKNEHIIALIIKLHSFVSKTKQPDLKRYLNFSTLGWRWYFRDLLERGLCFQRFLSHSQRVTSTKIQRWPDFFGLSFRRTQLSVSMKWPLGSTREYKWQLWCSVWCQSQDPWYDRVDCKLPQQYLGFWKSGSLGGLREETLAVPTRDDLFPVHLRKTVFYARPESCIAGVNGRTISKASR